VETQFYHNEELLIGLAVRHAGTRAAVGGARAEGDGAMITTPTTFVVGGGASKPYGLPLGAELYAASQALTPKSSLYQLLRETASSTLRS
jgi:hypothetical protein